MKHLFVTALTVLAFSASALAQGISNEQMQKLIERAEQNGGRNVEINTGMLMAAMGMHRCLQEKIGDAGMKKMAENAKALNDQVKPLCAQGKRDEAMALQMDYAKSVMKTNEYKQMRVCADQYKAAFNSPAFNEIRTVFEQPDQTDKNICDYQGSLMPARAEGEPDSNHYQQ
jgi:phosphosulfolactate synthase (CoM biosynthesis protein A)